MFNEHNSKELIEILKKEKISLVGISVLTGNYYPAMTVTKLIKKNTDIPVIWGGAHADVRPEECLDYADMICMGEGEEALLELAKNISADSRLDTTIKNIVRNELHNLQEDLDRYPLPDENSDTQYLMNDKGFNKWEKKFMLEEYDIITSRGCPHNCAYCYNNYRRKQYHEKGEYVRLRSIDNIIRELARAKSLYTNLRFIRFHDDNITNRSIADLERFKELYLKNINLPFYAMADPRSFNKEKIKIFRECGLSKLQIGIQSGSERVRKEIYNRPVPNKEILEMARYANQLGIKVLYDLIFNNPYEMRDDIGYTIKLLLKLPRPFNLEGYNLLFYPETDITKKALRDGYISLKSNKNDFSTITEERDSPIAMKGRDVFSSRFYAINFNTQEKKYWNQIISMFEFRFVPKSLTVFLIRFFATSDALHMRIMLNGLINFYLTCRKIRNLFVRFILRNPSK
jgi:radical SAM superfamily enzyme YgiQ (UPF0313 family)